MPSIYYMLLTATHVDALPGLAADADIREDLAACLEDCGIFLEAYCSETYVGECLEQFVEMKFFRSR